MEEFKQSKLSKMEWISIEKKLDKKELIIMNIIKNGYDNVDIQHNTHLTLHQCIKINHKNYHYYIYLYILKPLLKKKYNLGELKLKPPKQPLNSADKIRIENIQHIEDTIEYIILEHYKKLNKTKKVKYYYNILYLFKHYDINIYFKQILMTHLSEYHFYPSELLTHSDSVIENNPIFDYKPIELHKHQKDMYTTLRNNKRSLIFYTSPTSSGKTITPIGLCQEYKVIFICASRHIGIHLAKSAINVGVKTGFAFGCNSNQDIRLHYFSVHSYTSTKHPNHSDGSKLDMLICDIHSYEYAMEYMLSFFDKERLILFWDEPTITMDYDHHSLHESLSQIWKKNVIPRIVLSSATLPNNLEPIVEDYKKRFEGEFYKIETIDHLSNITLLDSKQNIIMPHNYFKDKEDVERFLETKGQSYLKFLSIGECANYILKSSYKDEFNQISIDEIDAQFIKLFYYKVIRNELFTTEQNSLYINDTYFTTKSASHITHGPAIWIVGNIETYVSQLIQQMNIQPYVLDQLDKKIIYNVELNEKINKLKKDYQDKIAKDEDNENKMKNQRFSPDIIGLSKHIEQLEGSYKQVQLDPLYIPNTYEHFTRWSKQSQYNNSNVFKGDLDETYVTRIMNTRVDFNYKVLLLLGIGVLHEVDLEFNDIMKELADAKQLMLILATSDYIYGTNYQFAHGYLSEDIRNITQEKIIQAIGRVGRKEKNKIFTFHFLRKEYSDLFLQDNPSKEGMKMNELFCCL
jgi:hypothetical protein